MFELTFYNRNQKNQPTTKVTKSFMNGAAMAEAYEKGRFKSIDKEFEAYHKKYPIINLNRPLKKESN